MRLAATLDYRAVNYIKRILADEIRNEDFQDTLDSNAPWTNISYPLSSAST